MFSMPFILSKMLSLGLSLTDAISATTEKPAKWIGMEDQIGCLSAGSFADVAIFDLKDKDFTYRDRGRSILHRSPAAPSQSLRSRTDRSFTAILNSNQTSQQEGNIVKKLGLSTRVFIGFGLGILLGVIFGEKILVIKIIGDIFLKLIKMLTVPLVFFSIISGITNLTDVNKLKRVGAKILGMYVVTTLLAGFIGLGIAHLINPGVGFQIDSSAIGSYEATAIEQRFRHAAGHGSG